MIYRHKLMCICVCILLSVSKLIICIRYNSTMYFHAQSTNKKMLCYSCLASRIYVCRKILLYHCTYMFVLLTGAMHTTYVCVYVYTLPNSVVTKFKKIAECSNLVNYLYWKSNFELWKTFLLYSPYKSISSPHLSTSSVRSPLYTYI